MRQLSRINLRDKENLSIMRENKGKFIAVYSRVGIRVEAFFADLLKELSGILRKYECVG